MLHDADITIIAGLTGSGKSYHCMKWMIEFVRDQRRPVYTNQPIRWKELRAYLGKKYGPEIAGLIRPLTHSLFESFIDRVSKQATFIREARERLAEEGSELLDDEPALHEYLAEQWEQHAGEEVWQSTYGEGGKRQNMIPATSCILIDELHEWYPSKNYQAKDGEKKWLLDFMTMHRHSNYKLIFATQRAMQVSHTIRRLAHTWYFVVNKRDQKLLWGLRFEHIARLFPAWKTVIGIRRYTALDIDDSGAPLAHAKPIQDSCIFASMPHNLWVFGLYNSHSRLGDEQMISKALGKVRADAGLDAEGRTPAEQAAAKKRAQREKSVVFRTIRMILGGVRRLAFALVFVVIGATGAMVFDRDWRVVASEQPAAIDAGEQKESEVDPYENWPTLQSVSADYVRLGGERVYVGANYRGHLLSSISSGSRAVLWIRDDDGFMGLQRLGGTRPAFLGPAAQVRAELARTIAGGTDSGPPDRTPGELAGGEGDDDGGTVPAG